jgi:adenylate cyclase
LETENEGPVKIGIGVHLGDVVLGEIGAQDQAPRTLIGDAVNTTSRLEGATKEHQVQAFISAPVLEAAGIIISSEHMIKLALRGVADPISALAIYPDTNLPVHLNSLQREPDMASV